MRRKQEYGEAKLVEKLRTLTEKLEGIRVATISIYYTDRRDNHRLMFSWGVDSRLHVYNQAIRHRPDEVVDVLGELYPDQSFTIRDGKLFLGDQELPGSKKACVALPFSYDKLWIAPT